MLTAYQCEVVAFSSEYGDLICYDCAHAQLDEGLEGATLIPLIRYSLDEEQLFRGEDHYGDAPGHDADCECLPAIYCDACGTELVEEYLDARCEDVEGR